MRPSLDSFKQASSNALSKAQLMVGLNGSNSGDGLNINNESDDIELAASNNSKNGESDSERTTTFVEEAADLLCPELTFQQRLLGFATCFTIAYMITFMSFKFFVQLIEGYPVPFAINYSAGNLLAMSASGFLCGPKRQFRNMFDEKRRTVSIVYLSCLFSTLVVVFIPIYWPAKLTILITLVITQCSANIWYSLSYVPYGRRTALKLMKRYLGLNGNGGGSAEGSGFMGLGGSGELS